MKKLLLSFALVLGVFSINAQTIGLVGPAANGWPDDNNPTPDIMLTDNGDGTYSIDALTLTTGSAKFREDQMWTTSYGGNTFPTGSITSGDIPVVAGVYDIVLDLNNNTYTFTDVSTFPNVQLVGSALGGGASPQMATLDGENYELGVTLFSGGDIQFEDVDSAVFYGSNSFPNGTATSGGMAIPVTNGYYQVTFNLTTGAYNFEIPPVGIVGPAAAGWPDDTNPTPDILMSSSDGDVYSLNGQQLNDGALKFRQNLNWNVSWGGDTFPSGSFTGTDINVTAGSYDISFFRANQMYTFTNLSIDSQSFENFKLFPNPTKDVWVFDNQNVSIQSIEIYNTFGKLIYQSNPNSTTERVNAQGMAEGIYLAKVLLSDNSETTVKIIKQ